MPGYRYNGQVTQALLEDLAAVVSNNDWRPALEGTSAKLKRAAKHICKAVQLILRAANASPTYATIPQIVWESTSEMQVERQRIAALPAGDQLFGKGGAIESLSERQRRTVIDPGKVAPDFLKAMLVYAERCTREADRIEGILKVRNRRYDRLGPQLNLIRDVQGFTGKPHDDAVARLLADAYQIAGGAKQFSPEAVRKLRKRHLSS
jgi:hypothetical protein